MGGYVGAVAFVVVYDGGVRTVDMDGPRYGLIASGCTPAHFPPPQAAFLDTPTSPAASGGSVADELTKLADLLARGVITQAEFNAQKTKLLAR